MRLILVLLSMGIIATSLAWAQKGEIQDGTMDLKSREFGQHQRPPVRFDHYLHFKDFSDQQLLEIAEDNPDVENKKLFSEHLVRVSDAGVINTRQAKGLYNRYFNVKFVSFTGDYSTCSQTCPVQTDVVKRVVSWASRTQSRI